MKRQAIDAYQSLQRVAMATLPTQNNTQRSGGSDDGVPLRQSRARPVPGVALGTEHQRRLGAL